MTAQFYPGSRQPRKTVPGTDATSPADVEEHLRELVGKPIIKPLPDGTSRELYTLGAFANAMGRSPITVRLWIRKGYLPMFPYRHKAAVGRDGVTREGRRYITFPMILAAYESFAARGLLGKPRIEWSLYPDLPAEIRGKWKTRK